MSVKPMIKPIKIVEVKSEIGAGTRGASMGIDAIKIAALDFGSFSLDALPHFAIIGQNGGVDFLWQGGTSYLPYESTYARVRVDISNETENIEMIANLAKDKEKYCPGQSRFS